MRALRLLLLLIPAATVIGGLCPACGSGSGDAGNDTISGDTLRRLPDTLRVVTLYSPMSFFLYREDTLGYDYSLVRRFANAKGLYLDIDVAPNLERAVNMLDSGMTDLIAYEVPVTAEYKETVYPCGPQNYTSQVLVQHIENDKPLITDVTELVGKEVWVVPNSKYQYRLENLNQELGGGITIRMIDRDTIIGEDLIEMVSRREIPFTVVDSDIARLNKTYHNDVDISLEISFRQRSSWGVAPDKAWLGDSISVWFETEGTRRENEMLLRRYFELSKSAPAFNPMLNLSKGHVSPYDALFKKYAAEIGWDWRLLAAQGYVESQYRSDVVSWAGARGIMQIMPSTARAYGVSPDALVNPETSIRVAARILKATEDIMARYIKDPTERRKFVVAAYNSGAAHIIDAIALADKYGKRTDKWAANVESALLMKSDRRYINDPVVKYGYFRGRQTTEYVSHVYDLYDRIKKQIKQ